MTSAASSRNTTGRHRLGRKRTSGGRHTAFRHRQRLEGCDIDSHVALVIGPEGGLTAEEVEAIKSLGSFVKIVSLGELILPPPRRPARSRPPCACTPWAAWATIARQEPDAPETRGVLIPRFHIHTLGCKVNMAESEAIAAALLALGWTRATDAAGCDVAILNTCTVTGEADAKNRKAAPRAAAGWESRDHRDGMRGEHRRRTLCRHRSPHHLRA